VVGFETGSLIEALASGKPVIFVARQNGFSQNPLVDFPEGSVRVCYSPSELAEALAHYHSLSMEERSSFRSQSRRVRDLYFTPISNETLEPFLG
jgi:glycosyltransferase involved in cell wall biosynthesis